MECYLQLLKPEHNTTVAFKLSKIHVGSLGIIDCCRGEVTVEHRGKKDPRGRVSKLCFRRKRFGLWCSSCQALVLEGSGLSVERAVANERVSDG